MKQAVASEGALTPCIGMGPNNLQREVLVVLLKGLL